MGTTLTGKRVQNTYDSLLKLSDNDNLTGVAKIVGDGLGNNSPIYLSTTQIGIGVTPSYEFHTNSHAKIGGNLIVGGNLTVDGTTTIVDSTVVAIGDNMIELAKDNVANVKDIGWYGTINSSGEKYVGMFYDASDGITVPTFRVGLGTSEPGSTMTLTTKGKLVIGALDATTGVFSGQVTIPATPVASTDAASKSYVDAQITAQDLDIAGDSGTGAVDLDSQTFTISGGTNVTTSVSGQTVTINASGGIDGSGTANDVVMWQDSDTLTDAPIAISGNNATFAGNINVADSVTVTGSGFGSLELGGPSGGYIDLKAPASDDYDIRIITSSGGNEITTASGDLKINTGNTLALTLDGSNQNATFAGNISLGGATIANDYKIEVIPTSGNILRSTRGTSVFAMYQANNSHAYIGTTSDNEFRILQNDTTALTINTSGHAVFANNVFIPNSGYIKFGSYSYIGEDLQSLDSLTIASDHTESIFLSHFNPADSTYTTNLEIDGDGDAIFSGNVDIYTGDSSATLNIGRNSSERLTIYQDDNHTTLTADNDSDGDGDHDFRLNRTFDGSGANNFIVQKDGTAQLTIDTNANATFAKNILFTDGAAYTSGASIRQQSSALILSGGSSGYYFNKSDNSATHFRIASDGNSNFTNKLGVAGTTMNANHANFSVNLSQTSGTLGAANYAHFGSQAHSSGAIMGITLGYKEHANLAYRKIGLVAEGTADGAARQHFHILVDDNNDSNSVVVGDSKLKINGLTGDVTIPKRLGIGIDPPTATLHVSDASNSGVTTISANNRIKLSGDGVLRWGPSANYGVLTWDTNKAIVGGQTGSTLELKSGSNFGLEIDTAGDINSPDLLYMRQTRFGYSASYKVVQFGNATTTSAISIGYNPSGNASGGFTGNEILIPNNRRILAPNAADNSFMGVIMFNDDDHLLLGGTNYNMDSTFALRTRGTGTGVIIRGGGTHIANENIGELKIGYAYASSGGTAGSATRLAIQPYAHTGGPWVFIARDTSSSAFLDIGYSARQITMKHNGYLALGNDNPQYKLDVNGTGAFGVGNYRTYVYGSSNGSFIEFGTNADNDALGVLGTFASAMIFSTNQGLGHKWQISGNDKMQLTTAGNLLVGSVGSAYSGTGVTSLTVNNNDYPLISLGTSSGSRMALVAYSSVNSFDSNQSYRFQISNDPKVTILNSNMTGGWDETLRVNNQYPVLSFQSDAGPGYYAGLGYDGGYGLRFYLGGTSTDITGTGTHCGFIEKAGRWVIGAGSTDIHTSYALTIAGVSGSYASAIRMLSGSTQFFVGANSTSSTSDFELWNSGNGYIRFATNNIEYMRLTSSGYVLIGQTSNLTSKKLQVNGFIDITQTTAAIRWYDGTTFVGGVGSGQWAFSSTYATDLSLYAQNNLLFHAGTGSTIDMFIRGNHTVGMTDDGVLFSPSTQLHVKNVSDAQLTLEGRASTWAGVLYKDVNGQAYNWFYGSTQTWAFGGGGSAVSGKRIHCDGGMTIGANYDSVTMPTNGLWVQGTIKCADDLVAFDSSDKRLKDDIKKIENPLDKLDKINGYKFKWNDNQEIHEGEDYGVIAQEVQEVMPEIVNLKESGYYGVKYDKLIPLLIESVKELKAEIKELKNCKCDCK